ncbi:MAG: response regulator [Planctomycetaceae bacterium]|nr:response regulator [Planctomycetaceae bacterium]
MARILVVDDALLDLRMAGALLESEPEWEVLYAHDGKQALEQIEKHLPDIVVTDLQMPGMNGLELVETMRNEFPLIPAVLMTAAGSEQIAVEAIEKGAASYVPKKELAAELVQTVSRLLTLSATQRGQRRLMNYLTTLEYVLDNDLEVISILVHSIREMIQERWLLDDGQCLRFATAIDEAIQNAFFHGNLEVSSDLREEDALLYRNLAEQRRTEEPYCWRRIHVLIRFTKQQISVTIRDEGPGFDPQGLPDPTAPGYLERPCGRGVLLMRSFCDDVQFNERGNEVTLIKRTMRPPDELFLEDVK